MSKRKGLLLGDYSNPQWHPIKGIDQEILDCLEDQVELRVTEDYGTLDRSSLEGIDILITYADCWKEKTSPTLVDAIVSYVSGGGAILCLHNGIIVGDYELAQMFGAKFTMHPPYSELEFRVSAEAHPILDEVDGWVMGDEPYQFDFDSFHEKTMLLEYQYEGRSWPAGWVSQYGLGNMVYLAPGHDARSFQNPMYRRLLTNSCKWLLEQG